MDFMSGAFSGMIQTLVGYPLDTLKVLQQNNMRQTHTLYNGGFVYALTTSILQNSFLFKVFKDCHATIDNAYVSGCIAGALSTPFVFLLDSFKIRHQTRHASLRVSSIFYNNGKMTTLMCESSATGLYFGNYKKLIEYEISPFMAGGISGTFNWLVGYPIDVIKTRQITYNITIQQAIQMGAFHKGLTLCLARAFLVNSFGFYAYEYGERHFR